MSGVRKVGGTIMKVSKTMPLTAGAAHSLIRDCRNVEIQKGTGKESRWVLNGMPTR